MGAIQKTALLMALSVPLFFSEVAFGGVVGTINPEAMQDYPVYSDNGASGYRDPFAPSPKMYRESGTKAFDPYGENSFVPVSTKLPKMWVRGFVNGVAGKPLALLQVQGEETVYMVSEGDKIGIQSVNNPANPNMVLEILSVDNKQVKVREGNLGQVVVVQ